MEVNSSCILNVFPPCLLENWWGVGDGLGEDTESPGGSVRGPPLLPCQLPEPPQSWGRGDTARDAPRPRAPRGSGGDGEGAKFQPVGAGTCSAPRCCVAVG